MMKIGDENDSCWHWKWLMLVFYCSIQSMHVVPYHITIKSLNLIVYHILYISCTMTIIWEPLYLIYVQALFADVIVVDTRMMDFLLQWIDLEPNSFVTQMAVVPGGDIHCRQALYSSHHRIHYGVDK